LEEEEGEEKEPSKKPPLKALFDRRERKSKRESEVTFAPETLFEHTQFNSVYTI
jgi:hypothetical protein